MQKHIERPVHRSKTQRADDNKQELWPLSAREFMKLPVSRLMPAGKRLTFLARIIHERFCCNRGFAAATGLSAGGLAARSVDILFKDASLPHGSTRPSRFTTPQFRDEPS